MEMRATPSGASRNRGQWIMLTDEQAAEMLAEKRKWRTQIQKDWKTASAGRDIEELRREQAYRAVIDQARWHKIELRDLEKKGLGNPDFEGDTVNSLIKKIFFEGGRVEPGYTGLFDHCTRPETEGYVLEAMQRVIAENN